MNDPDSLRRLQAELENDYRFIERCGKELNTFSQRWRQSSEDEMVAIAVAYGLHNLYGAFEGYFLRIFKHFENHLPSSNWRSELVEKMTFSPLHQHFQAWLGELIANEAYTIDSRGQ